MVGGSSQYQNLTDISFYQRASKGKIMNEDKYKGGKPGSLDLRVNYDAGCLYVGLGQASLYGKPSQVLFISNHIIGHLLILNVVFILFFTRTRMPWSTFWIPTLAFVSSRLATTKPRHSTRTSSQTLTQSSNFW